MWASSRRLAGWERSLLEDAAPAPGSAKSVWSHPSTHDISMNSAQAVSIHSWTDLLCGLTSDFVVSLTILSAKWRRLPRRQGSDVSVDQIVVLSIHRKLKSLPLLILVCVFKLKKMSNQSCSKLFVLPQYLFSFGYNSKGQRLNFFVVLYL